MARSRKSWQEKLTDAKVKAAAPRVFFCERSKQRLLIPAVAEVEQLMRGVRRGRVLTVKQMMEVLRARHGADACCPITAGIFSWIIAHAADEAEEAGQTRVVPWWRLVRAGGELNPKYPGAGIRQQLKLEAEGHRVIAKGSKLIVEGVSQASAARPKAPPTGGMERKVLAHADFGLCVLLPKTEWGKVPESGPATVDINGAPRRVVVQVERCNCQGDGWHQHRFLSLPRAAGVREHDRVTVRFPS
jgi:alkylated DNA nucleotide flippase Atl1